MTTPKSEIKLRELGRVRCSECRNLKKLRSIFQCDHPKRRGKMIRMPNSWRLCEKHEEGISK